MPRFAANLHYLFTELPFLDRFAAAAEAGFRGVEAQVPYHHPATELARRLHENDLEMVLLDTAQGNWDAGERGLAAVPGREHEFRAGVAQAIEYATALNCRTVHVIAGVTPPGADPSEMERTYRANLLYAAEAFAPHGIAAVIEPINPSLGVVPEGELYTTLGMRGFYLTSTARAVQTIKAVDHPNLHLHLDMYHMQMTEGRLADTLRQNIHLVRHLQLAGVPGRHEPDVGEINYPYLFDLIDQLGFTGWIGCEYKPRGATLDGLGWARRYGIKPKST